MSGRSDIEKALKLYIDHLKTINFKHTFLTIICIYKNLATFQLTLPYYAATKEKCLININTNILRPVDQIIVANHNA